MKLFAPKQIWEWMYKKGVNTFAPMSNLPIGIRENLEQNYCIDHGFVQHDVTSKLDETRKFLISYKKPNEVIETVFIPEPSRGTQCISSQIGCSLSCTFCHTGTQKLIRNLTASEIVGQYMILASRLNEFPFTPNHQRKISNMVFMGQGEPLYNYRNVSKAIQILTDPRGIALPKARITVSTSGVVPAIEKIPTELGVSLAISLHAVSDDIRDKIVPLNKTWPIKELMNACRNFVHLADEKTKRITFEYVMLDGVNDSLADARELSRMLKELPAHVNLIPFNPWPGSTYKCTPEARLQQFVDIVNEGGTKATIRRPRGRDIFAACGQLKSNVLSKAQR
ncbi:hypothetical protein K493DRAFT_268697 [Basidiobolus meristosporus CBS 931.73]|uniref:Radical SAM core domain-containing protein n=1 Tax=Basidiobolus meristosporus CBS 931.73 TaxID=1314790 RepID=A0A1Y1XPD9_9FUNG|nr:hypothetical protein K493DRAFT_268697 [Basidiobolus meristosporus CBS 931.73]|eukprot:ORX87535.1 hypothetical protein K493DRAFT_268697 [Basidiobolus meristosporus CBS 931.73]